MTPRERPRFDPVAEPFTAGMIKLEQALAIIDDEAVRLGDWPEEVIRRMAQIEHCQVILLESLARHLPKEVRESLPAGLFDRNLADRRTVETNT